MATLSNRERVGEALDLLAEGLLPFIDPRMTAAASQVGGDWVRLISARDESKHGKSMRHHKEDPALLLRVLTEDWRVFSGELSRSSGRSPRNFERSATATHTTTRLPATTPTAPSTRWSACSRPSARQVRPTRSAACGWTTSERASEAEVKRMAKAQEVPPTLAGQGLAVARCPGPHEDVATGNFSPASSRPTFMPWPSRRPLGRGSRVWRPREFFRRTYLTEGLRELLDRAIRRIDGDPNATPDRQPPDELRWRQDPLDARAVAHVLRYAAGGTTPGSPGPCRRPGLCPTSVGRPRRDSSRAHRNPNHRRRHHRAHSLGRASRGSSGAGGIRPVAEADRTATNPGARLRDIIAAHSPRLILIDEWVATRGSCGVGRSCQPGPSTRSSPSRKR